MNVTHYLPAPDHYGGNTRGSINVSMTPMRRKRKSPFSSMSVPICVKLSAGISPGANATGPATDLAQERTVHLMQPTTRNVIGQAALLRRRERFVVISRAGE